MVDEHGRPGPRSSAHIERLVIREVAAPDVVFGARHERGLDDEHVSATGGFDERVVRASVTGDRDQPAGPVADHAAPGRDVVEAGDELDREVADLDPLGVVVLDDLEGVVEEPLALADRRCEFVKLALPAGREEDRDPPAREAGPRHQVAERHEVDVVVRVEVADDDRVQLARVLDRHQAADHALAAVHEDRRRGGLDENPGRRGLRLRSGRACPDDRDAGHGWTDSLSIAGMVA